VSWHFAKIIYALTFKRGIMLKEAGIVIIAVCCVFSIIPLSWLNFGPIHWPAGAMISLTLLFVVLGIAAYDAKKLFECKVYGLAKNFIAALVFSVILAIIVVAVIWPYTLPPFEL
jgi:hypothetical protein